MWKKIVALCLVVFCGVCMVQYRSSSLLPHENETIEQIKLSKYVFLLQGDEEETTVFVTDKQQQQEILQLLRETDCYKGIPWRKVFGLGVSSVTEDITEVQVDISYENNEHEDRLWVFSTGEVAVWCSEEKEKEWYCSKKTQENFFATIEEYI